MLKGLSVRPTSDRLRETLFNILAPQILDSTFLDVCAGSGAVGIEALSRGASEVCFIENDRAAYANIEANLRALSIEAQARVLKLDALAAIDHLAEAGHCFDLVFFDPPYASSIYDSVMSRLDEGELIADDAIVVVEYLAKTPPANEYYRLKRYRELKQGESALAFYRRGGPACPPSVSDP